MQQRASDANLHSAQAARIGSLWELVLEGLQGLVSGKMHCAENGELQVLGCETGHP